MKEKHQKHSSDEWKTVYKFMQEGWFKMWPDWEKWYPDVACDDDRIGPGCQFTNIDKKILCYVVDAGYLVKWWCVYVLMKAKVYIGELAPEW